MATFSRATFNSAGYASYRPTYPRQLFDFIFKYHERAPGARWETAIDLGCGTGQATTELTPFKHVIGVDPSAGMVSGARQALKTQNLEVTGQFEFVQSGAEELPFVKDGSADLIIAAQACHWFDYSRMWSEAARVLRPGGSLAFWIYSEFRFSRYPTLTPLITEYAQGNDPATSLGPHWQQPGRSILDNHLVAVPSAQDMYPDKFNDWERVYFTGDHYPDLPSSRPVILRKKLKWADVYPYLQTWSSFHTYQERYPDDKQHQDGDIGERLLKALKEGAAMEGASVEDGDEVDVEWPMAMLLVKRR